MTEVREQELTPFVDPIAPLRAALRSRYDILRQIGQGAFATVYLARDLKHDRKVAIKVLTVDSTSDTSEIRFIREIKVLARLQHPNILPLHDSGHVEALLYYVMPYVAGETLRQKIDRERRLPLEDAICIAEEAADALACAHSQGIIHRDIKPENILISGGHAIVADFGIARAIDVAGIRQLTRTGVGSPGTPAYMAPEQLLGDQEVDVRSDIYSLGCVLYEMLSGKPPFAGKEGFVKRFTEPPPAPSVVRPSVPKWADAIIATSLARNPADRFAGAADMARALSLGLARERTRSGRTSATGLRSPRSTGESPVAEAEKPSEHAVKIVGSPAAGPKSPSPSGKAEGGNWWRRVADRPRVKPLLVGTAALATIGFVATAFIEGHPDLRRALGVTATLDSTRFVVLPLLGTGPGAQAVAARVSDRLYDAARAWDGIDVVGDLQVDQKLRGGEGTPRSLAEAIAIARELGAGRLVWGHVGADGGTFRTRAELYDVNDPTKSKREVLLPNDDDSPPSYARSVSALFAPRDRSAAAAAADGQTHNFPAWQAYNRGQNALDHLDIALATSELERAVDNDPAFPAALVWLAQVKEWKNPLSADLWGQHAQRAFASRAVLTSREQNIAAALSALSQGRYQQACAAYRSIAQTDSVDFVGWYGLGECQALDSRVVPDKSSSSGWRFRSSYGAAGDAYRRALSLEPRAHALLSFARLKRLMPIAPTAPVGGADATGEAFAAYPSLIADTLAFIPYPVTRFNRLPASSIASLDRAISRNIESLYSIAEQWVQHSPQNADAYETLADVLETRGNIQDVRGAAPSAITTAQRALELSRDPRQTTRLRVRLARLLVKRGSFAAARRLSDSVMAGATIDATERFSPLAGLAALTGRVAATALFAGGQIEAPRSDDRSLPVGVAEAHTNLFVAAAFGLCGDTLTVLEQNLDQQLESSIPEAQRSSLSAELKSRALSMMVPCTGGRSALRIASSQVPLYRLQQAFAHHDRRLVQSVLKEIDESRRALRPTDVSLDHVYQEAWIRAASGDTLGASRQLDRSLNAIAALSAESLREPAAAAALGRALILRAELASATGDVITAQRWARAASDLWANADAPLQPAVGRMRALAGTKPAGSRL